MDETEFERCVCRIAALLYRCDEAELVHAQQRLERLSRLAADYRRALRPEPTGGEPGSAAHLCGGPPVVRSVPPRRHRDRSR